MIPLQSIAVEVIVRDEFFNDYREAVKCRDEHIRQGRPAELIPRLRVGNIIYRVRSEDPQPHEDQHPDSVS
jgi:hypothetical protein